MKILNDVTFIQTLRPRVIELEYGIFRGYVDILERRPGAAASKVRYCQNVCMSRDLAERQALELATHLNLSARGAGAYSRLLCDSLSDTFAGRSELDSVPSSLLRRDTATTPVVRRHLRVVA
ncbi:hypothetical protein [Bordetella sp. 2513F-2]